MIETLTAGNANTKLTVLSFDKYKFIAEFIKSGKEYDNTSIIEFFEKHGEFYYERMESFSKNTIKFHMIPNVFRVIMTDTNALMSIGYVQNECGIIREFYLSEDGRFYAKASKKDDEHLVLISDNENAFLQYIKTIEYDHHIMISTSTYETLRKAGWYENRKVKISDIVNGCKKAGYSLSKAQIGFLEEFSGITGKTDEGYSFFIAADEEWYSVSRDYDDDLCSEYGNEIVYVGNIAFSGKIYITPDGKMLLEEPGSVFGRTIMEGFELIFRNAKKWG